MRLATVVGCVDGEQRLAGAGSAPDIDPMVRIHEWAPLGGVLVGGESRRFGADKATALLAGRPLAEWAAKSLSEVGCDPVVLLGRGPDLAARLGLDWRPDILPGAGPLAGIAAALEWSAELGRHGVLVLACDLPLVTSSLLRGLLERVDGKAEAVVPRQGARPGVQPLCAWYGPAALPRLRERLECGERSARGLVEVLATHVVDLDGTLVEEEDRLLNVNTPEDLARAERLLAAAAGSPRT